MRVKSRTRVGGRVGQKYMTRTERTGLGLTSDFDIFIL